MKAQFPEFYHSCEQRFAERSLLHSERRLIAQQRQTGVIPNSVAANLMEELDRKLRKLRGYDTSKLRIDPHELLRNVPYFSSLPEADVPRLLACLKQRTIPARQDLIQQGATDQSLFLIARGELKILRTENGREVEIDRVGAGEFVGEGGFVKRQPRNATCRAVTPCAVYELRRRDLDIIKSSCPALLAAMAQAIEDRPVDFCPIGDK